MTAKFLKKFALAAAASSLALGAGATASAGGYYGHAGGYYGHGGYYKAGYRHGLRGHYRHRHRGGGGKGAAIALGVIGGAILLSEAAKASERERIYRERYEDRYYDRYDRYRRDRGRDYDRDAYRRGYEDGLERGRNDGGDSDADVDSDLDRRLEGRDGGPEPIRYSAAGAFETCTRHARQALAARDFILAAPSEPETAEDAGGSWKMTATVQAQNKRGESWSRAMYCEADEDRVYLLELI